MVKKPGLLLAVILVAVLVSLGAACSRLPSATSPAPSDPDFALLQEAWDALREEFVGWEDVDPEALIRGAVRGMANAVDDPYTAYLDPEAYDMSVTGLSGKFEGIGAWVGDRDGSIVIIAPIPDSPADRAGIRAGDIIMAIDGESTIDLSIMDAVRIIRGPKGTPVLLQVLHEDSEEPDDIEIIRDEIELESVNYEMIDEIAHITITNFTDRTAAEMSDILEELDPETAAIILDMRYNPGGLLDAVVYVAGRFLDDGIVVYVVDADGNREDHPVTPHGETINLPMVVLVNEFSASGSEVLSGALQDHGRAVVAGTTTFGKGSVNILHRLSDGSGLYITVARWYTPSGRLIEGEGLEPDIELDPEEDAIEWALDYLRSDA
jgi:carboxyl-terminal processing protease